MTMRMRITIRNHTVRMKSSRKRGMIKISIR